jgi:hypothetical protein
MFFRRKQQPVSSAERRSTYRSPIAPQAQGLSVSVAGPSGRGVGNLVDVSARGARVSFPAGYDPALSVEDVVEATLQSLSHGDLRLTARVVHGAPSGQGSVLYGLEFLDAEQVLQDLNPFYARLFNRRAAPRVRPSLDRRVNATVSWEGGEARARVSELSVTGMGLSLPLVDAYRVMAVSEVYLSFGLPGIQGTFEGPARIVNRRPTGGSVHLGLAFDLEDPDGLGRDLGVLQEYVERRIDEIRRWESAAG